MNIRTLIALVISLFMFTSCSRDMKHADTPIRFYCNIDLPWEWGKDEEPKRSHPKKEEGKNTNDSTVTKPQKSGVYDPGNEDIDPDEEHIVYYTDYGDCYHEYGCGYLRSSCNPIPIEEARRKYRPCSRCY